MQSRPNLARTLCFMFSGKAGVGKTFLSDMIQKWCDEVGLKTLKSPFAYGVKETASFMGWDGNKDIRGRKLLQSIGNVGRVYDEDVWVRNTFIRIEEQVGYPFDAIFIDDWRFTNEFAYVFNQEPLYQPITIRVSSDSREILRGTPEYLDVSETQLDNFDFDYTIHNDVMDIDFSDCLHRMLVSEIRKNSVV